MAKIKSIKEKAKRYDEAIEELRGLLEGIHEDKCDIMEEDIIKIFPELKESEKIRNTIFDCLYKCCDSGVITREQRHICIAWLEKQGEQKPQGKTALEAINEEKVDNANKVEPRQEKLTEFEKAVKQVMEEAIECGDTRNLKADAEMLLSLVQESAWSEEDEKKVNNLYVLLDQMVSFNMLSNKDATEFKDCLKSLKDRVQHQNTWKPSDEQIKVLEFFIPYVTECSVVLQKSKDTLSSLLSDLKKLREG